MEITIKFDSSAFEEPVEEISRVLDEYVRKIQEVDDIKELQTVLQDRNGNRIGEVTINLDRLLY